ncbi:hypothetical protein [Kitasatospora sp. NPDC096140]|uniref:hypothetical protein n=1 Tax=Kitasatospora sp. NPDC096140 TaxID=3155425 RepID=UPI0033276E59
MKSIENSTPVSERRRWARRHSRLAVTSLIKGAAGAFGGTVVSLLTVWVQHR